MFTASEIDRCKQEKEAIMSIKEFPKAKVTALAANTLAAKQSIQEYPPLIRYDSVRELTDLASFVQHFELWLQFDNNGLSFVETRKDTGS